MESDRILKGLFVIVVGVILLSRELNLIPFALPDYLFSWPIMVIVFGVFLTLTKADKTGGLIVMGLGFLFLMQRMYHINPFQYWPVFIILAGLGILFKKNTYRRRNSDTTLNLKELNEMNVFSGSERRIASTEFNGGSVTSVFGGSEINLLNSTLAPGQNVIEVFSMFGGTTFYVPGDWNVRIEVVAIFGGFNDSRSIPPTGVANPERELVIKGYVIFGGGEIKSFR